MTRRPALRYPGGKWRIADWIIANLPPHEVYVEPFGGAASVLLRKDPSRIEVYNDSNQAIVNFFRILRDPSQAEELRRLITLTPFSRAEFSRSFDPTDDPLEAARRLVVQMFQGIGNKGERQKNGWRTRTAKAIWSPCLAWNGWPENMPQLVERLRSTIIEDLPAMQLFDIYDDQHTLFYVDPPYPLSTRSAGHRGIYSTELTDKDHGELLDRLLRLHSMVAISSYPNSLYTAKLKDWTEFRRRSRAQTNVKRLEVLWLNPAAAARAKQQCLEIA